MKYELTIYELGEALKKLEENYKLNVLIKKDLSGGWMTITGEATIDSLAVLEGGCNGKNVNILNLIVSTEDNNGAVVKFTGSKTKKFSVDIASTRYKEISAGSLSLNQIKIDDTECKLRIDQDIIFTLKAPASEISEIIEKFCK